MQRVRPRESELRGLAAEEASEMESGQTNAQGGAATHKARAGTLGLALLAVISLAAWLGPAAGDNPAEANHTVTVGIDTDVTGEGNICPFKLTAKQTAKKEESRKIREIIFVEDKRTALDRKLKKHKMMMMGFAEGVMGVSQSNKKKWTWTLRASPLGLTSG